MMAQEWSQYFYHYKSKGIFKRSGAADSLVPGPILANFEPIRDFVAVLVTCNNKEELYQNAEAIVVTRFFPFDRRTDAGSTLIL